MIQTDFVASLNIAFFYNGNVSVSKYAKIASLVCKLLCNFPTHDYTYFHFPYCSHIRTQLKEQISLNVDNTLGFHWLTKSKDLPRQAEVAQGFLGRLRLRIFLTFRHYKGGRSSAKRTVRLYPMRNPWYSLSEVESTSGHMVLSGVPRKTSPVTPTGIDPGTSRLAAMCLNHYANPSPDY